MKIPEAVVICGVKTDVKVLEQSYNKDGSSWDGYYDVIQNKIVLFAKSLSVDLDGTGVTIDNPDDHMWLAFYHELWHAMTKTHYLSDETCSETSAEMFGMVAMNIFGQCVCENTDIDLMCIFGKFKGIMPEIPENELAKLEYIAKNTHFVNDTDWLLSDDEYDNIESLT